MRIFQVLRCVVSSAVLVMALLAAVGSTAAANASPNIVFILADDLGYGDLGCYGQQRIRTPRIDQLAAAGLRFTSCYAGSTVCAPSRCALMTGLHTGHARIRGNSRVPLQPEDRTIAEILKQSGYVTGMFGKWGLGEPDTTGIPNEQGFDEWFGYLNQGHAHNYYPDYLWRNGTRETIVGNVVVNGVATQRAQYSPDLFVVAALDFLDRHQRERFFLYLPFTLPHANNEAGKAGMEIPSDAPYGAEPWLQPQRNHAAMITRLDADVGRIIDRLQSLGLSENTIVWFSSDNGPHREGGADPQFFQSAGPWRGHKRDLYEGGVRVPAIVAWPGHIKAGVSDFPWAFWDVLPTLAELAGATAPTGIDGQSLVPTLFGHKQPGHEYLYWEFHERGFKQAVRWGNWKLIRQNLTEPPELFNLSADPGEQQDVAQEHADVVARLTGFMNAARTESPDWPAPRPAPGQ